MVRLARVAVLALVAVTIGESAAFAQAIAGVVRDASGGVMPGVTVEAASPALIEKTRTAVTDGEGQYKIISLRPGTYSVTFTLVGFNTVRREGIEITNDFTAGVNSEMKIGAIEETITVSGQSPLIDTQSVTQKKALTSDIKEVYGEAKANGFDVKIMRKIVSIRKQDRDSRIEEETVLDLYLAALGMN